MRSIPVWDFFVRLTHWTVAVLVLADFYILDPDWGVHRWAGYVVLGFVALRLAWGLVGSRHARFSAFPPSLRAAREHLAKLLRGQHELFISHNPLGALMAYNIWASLIVTVVTGMMITTDRFWGIEWVAVLHWLSADWVLVSAALHVAGVVFETRHSKINLVRAMISGNKEIPGPGE